MHNGICTVVLSQEPKLIKQARTRVEDQHVSVSVLNAFYMVTRRLMMDAHDRHYADGATHPREFCTQVILLQKRQQVGGHSSNKRWQQGRQKRSLQQAFQQAVGII